MLTIVLVLGSLAVPVGLWHMLEAQLGLPRHSIGLPAAGMFALVLFIDVKVHSALNKERR